MDKDEKSEGLALLARIKAAINLMPTFPPVGSIAGDAVQKKTLAVQAASVAFRKKVGGDLERLAVLRARLLPDALLPRACNYGRGANELHDPVVHYMCCYDLCGQCREEALREVEELARAVKRGRRGQAFLPPHVAEGRISAANERERVANQRRASVALGTRESAFATLTRRAANHSPPIPLHVNTSDQANAAKAKLAATNAGPWSRFDGRSATKERFLRIANVFPRDMRSVDAKRRKSDWARYVGNKIPPTHSPRKKGKPSYYPVFDLKHHFERLAWTIRTPPMIDDVERWTVPSKVPMEGYDLNCGN